MTIHISPRAADLAADLAGRFVVLVRGATDPGRAIAGLEAARDALVELTAVVSPVVLSPQGPLLRVVELALDEEALQAVPGIVADALAESGLQDGTVEVVEPIGPLDELDRTSGAAVLRIFPRPAGAAGLLPAHWLDLAAEWALGDAAPTEHAEVRLLGAPFTVTASDAPAALHAANGARAWCDLVHGDLHGRIRSASLTFGHAPHLTLAGGGPGCDVPALLARFDLLCELARDLAGESAPGEVAYACVDLEDTFAGIGSGLALSGWRAEGGASPNAVAGEVVDVAVPDAFPYQVLGPGHRTALGPGSTLGLPLDGDHLELALGDAVDWLPRFETREEALEQGWKVLRSLLLTDGELQALLHRRAGPGATPSAARRSGPDLDDVVLEALPHPRRGLHVTLLELASWVGNEPHSDVPRSVSPVLAAYARWLASGLDDERRQGLRPYAARLVATRGPGLSGGGWRPLSGADDGRVWMAADWLARVQVPAWLRAAGLDALATRIAKVRPGKQHQHVGRLVLLLGTAIDQLRTDLQAAVLEDGEEAWTSEATWDDWEAASEASGWVAASEAAWVGVPDGLASGTELRVIELARDLHTVRGPKDKGQAIALAARTSALAAAAQAAWADAGRVAATAVDSTTRGEVHDISLVTALERAMRAVEPRLGVDRDTVEHAMEQAEAAARAELVHRIEAGPITGPSSGLKRVRAGAALEQARDAAADSDGGTIWTEVQELTRGIIGEAAWIAGMAAAGVAVDRVLQTARSLVDRAVLVAVAREAAGLAARTASALDHRPAPQTEPEPEPEPWSGHDVTAEPAMPDPRVATVTEELRGAALDLFDGLLAVVEPAAKRPRRRTPA